MAIKLYRLGRWAFRHAGLVVILWLFVLAGAIGAAVSMKANPSTEFSIPGTEAQQAFDLVDEHFPQAHAEDAQAQVVFQAPAGEKITDPENAQAMGQAVQELGSLPGVVSATDPLEMKQISPDQTTAFSTVQYDAPSFDLSEEDKSALEASVEKVREQGLTAEIGGNVLQAIPETGTAEILGIAIAAIVLLLTFRAVVAAGLPIVSALVGVGVTVTGTLAVTGPLKLDATTPILATMLGLAVGIDYALLIVSRYRAELREGHGPANRTPDADEAAGRALGTAGSAVFFAGLTVVIAMAGLMVVNIPILTKMGLAASVAVAMAVAVALTLIPALLKLGGKRVMPKKDRHLFLDHKPDVDEAKADERTPFGARWAKLMIKQPIVVLLIGIVGLGALALPVRDMELGLPDNGSQPTSTTQRKAYDMLAEKFVPGVNGPLLGVVDLNGNGNPEQALQQLQGELSQVPGVVNVTPPQPSPDGKIALVTVIGMHSPSSVEMQDLVHTLRDKADGFESNTGLSIQFTGQTAMGIDVSDRLSDAMLPYLALVVGLAFLLLILVFRSILVPLKAALGFLLSVLAALGAVVAVFQWGHLASVFGVDEPGPIMSLMPIFLIGIVFGLAMDYEMFVVTRIREDFVHGHTAREAIVNGMHHGVPVVTAAAVIMIGVFGSFIGGSDAMVKVIGFGLAVAVLFDAFIVRMSLVPAALALMGKAAWWLPRWWDKAMPNVDVEGEQLSAHLRARREAKAAESAESAEKDEVTTTA